MTDRRPVGTGAGILLLVVAAAVARGQSLPAFSGAEGPGSTATGGRGGDVYHVTTLAFDVSGTVRGSFQYGLKNAPSTGRTIVFDVGGTIYQPGGGTAQWFRADAGNITVAGQTAPGGITIAGIGTKWTGDNVILRNITVRPNKDPVNPSNSTYDGFSLQVKNSIVDHVSTSWYTDEGISITDAGKTSTVQYATIGEGLSYAGHAFGSIIATEVDGTEYSFNHNLYAHNSSRLPAIGSELGQTGAVLSFTNNVIYNWPRTKAGYSATDQHSSSNFISNYYITGYDNGVVVFSGGDGAASVGFTQLFQNKNDPRLANKADFNKNGVLDGVAFGPGDKMPDNQKFYSGSMAFVSTPFAVTGVTTPDTADTALQRVLAYGGANWQSRNPIDERIVDSVAAGTGRIIADLSGGTQAAEWATVLAQRADAKGNAPFSRPVNFDTDGDGMPDAWERKHGLNPSVADNNGDFDADGYTNLEEYINELGAWPAPGPITFTSSTSGRYAQIRNWDADPSAGVTPWQPSSFDLAVITGGTATVDAPGQYAGRLTVGGQSVATARLAVTAGWLEVADGITIGDAGSVVVSGGRLLASNLAVGLSGTASLTIGGGGVTISGTLSRGQTGSVTLAPGGTLQIGIGGTTGALATELTVNGTLVVDRTGTAIHGSRLLGTGTFIKAGQGTLALTAANPFAGATTIEQGVIRLDQAGALASSTVTPLTGGMLALAPGVWASLGSLRPLAGGLVDVGSGSITVAQGLSEADVTTALAFGRGDGRWNGSRGITSSVAAATNGALRTLGWESHTDGSIRIALVAPGDTNLDGVIDLIDLANMASSWENASGPVVWATGDFNYDAHVDLLDVAEFIGTSLFDTGPYATSFAVVPEPAGRLLAGLVPGALAVGIGAKRRRRHPPLESSAKRGQLDAP